MSALSTTAIKDGHQGHASAHTYTNVASTLDAERADRISRLAGLERVATLRGVTPHMPPGSATNHQQQPSGYFDHVGTRMGKERSTVGSASATESAEGRTTWTSGSEIFEADKMSEDQDEEMGSTAGLSDEGDASLVGFGEAASSAVSGIVSKGDVIRSQSGKGSPVIVNRISVDEGTSIQPVRKSILADAESLMQGTQEEHKDTPGNMNAKAWQRERAGNGAGIREEGYGSGNFSLQGR